MFVDDNENPLVPTGNLDSESEVKVVFDETTNLMASTSFKVEVTKGSCMGFHKCLERLYALEMEKLSESMARVIWKRVANVNNDINILDNYTLFDDLIDSIAHVAPFEVNGVKYEKGYYLADGIYQE
nr:protein ALP1-like [Tanacetum cinerariifolium]